MDITRHSLDHFVTNVLDKKAPQHLYHYCTKASANTIQNNGIYCTNSKSLSDKTECTLGWEHAKNILGNYNSDDWSKNLIQAIDLCRKDNTFIRFWSFSLCENGNSPTMKERYGAPLLKFKYRPVHNEITQFMRNDLVEPLQSLHFILPCFYLSQEDDKTHDNEKIQALIQFIFSDYLNKYLKNLYNTDMQKKTVIAAACSFMLDAIIKDSQFSDEQEWRIIVITFDDKSVNCCKFGGRCRLYSGLSYTPEDNLNCTID